MKIGEVLRGMQPKEYGKLHEKPKKKAEKNTEKLSFNDVKSLMKHDSYRRGRGGAMRQK